MAPIRFRHGAALAVAATIGFQVYEESLEPPDIFHPHTHQEDHSPFATRTTDFMLASGVSSITSARNLARFGPRPPYSGALYPWDFQVGDVERAHSDVTIRVTIPNDEK
jgi:hypothetical protein